jgi:cbb3-type cytochrome oxidase subunit 3
MVLKRSKAGCFLILFFNVFCAAALDTTTASDESKSINSETAAGNTESNANIALPDGKKINRAELDRKAEKLNFDEKKKKEQNTEENGSIQLPRMSSMNPGEGMKIFAFVIALSLLLAVLIYLILKTGKRNAVTQQASASAAEWEDAWNLDTGEVDSLYFKAVQEGDYRLAIRLAYLRNLRRLIDRKLVNPSPEKTNRQYAKELQSSGLSNLFTQTTRVYETVWYGEANPDKQNFERVITGFLDMFERAGKA